MLPLAVLIPLLMEGGAIAARVLGPRVAGAGLEALEGTAAKEGAAAAGKEGAKKLSSFEQIMADAFAHSKAMAEREPPRTPDMTQPFGNQYRIPAPGEAERPDRGPEWAKYNSPEKIAADWKNAEASHAPTTKPSPVERHIPKPPGFRFQPITEAGAPPEAMPTPPGHTEVPATASGAPPVTEPTKPRTRFEALKTRLNSLFQSNSQGGGPGTANNPGGGGGGGDDDDGGSEGGNAPDDGSEKKHENARYAVDKKLAALGVAAAGTVVALLKMPNALQRFGDGLTAGNEHLRMYNARIAASFAVLDMRKIQNEIELGRRTEGSTSNLNQAVGDMQQQLVPWRAFTTNLMNNFNTRMVNLITFALRQGNKVLDNNKLTRAAEEMDNILQNGGNKVLLAKTFPQFLDNIAAGAYTDNRGLDRLPRQPKRRGAR